MTGVSGYQKYSCFVANRKVKPLLPAAQHAEVLAGLPGVAFQAS